MPLKTFEALSTQWNISHAPSGAIRVVGLRYEALPFVLDVQGIHIEDRAGLFESLRIMEQEALKVFSK